MMRRQSSTSLLDPGLGAGADQSVGGGNVAFNGRDRHSRISAVFVTSVAPSRIRLLQPSARGSSGDPGIAMTSLPRSDASLAVINDPERAAASMTTTPKLKPAIIRLRMGKWCGVGWVVGGISAMIRPDSSMACCNFSFSGG